MGRRHETNARHAADGMRRFDRASLGLLFGVEGWWLAQFVAQDGVIDPGRFAHNECPLWADLILRCDFSVGWRLDRSIVPADQVDAYDRARLILSGVIDRITKRGFYGSAWFKLAGGPRHLDRPAHGFTEGEATVVQVATLV